uniref:Uncharacterized protein n=1 Tax=Arion vulgaris TaxID=1028688 RepID=A0A0B7AXS7_9EUPU
MGQKTWRTTKKIPNKIQTINLCLHRLETLRWYDRVTSEKLMDRTRQIPVKQDTKKRHRCWI